HLEGPQRLQGDRVTRRSVTNYGFACCLLDHVLCSTGVRGKLVAIELVDQPMPIGMTRRLVASGHDLPYEARVSLGDPAEDKKRPLYATLVEQIQQALRVRFNAARLPTPSPQGGRTRKPPPR